MQSWFICLPTSDSVMLKYFSQNCIFFETCSTTQDLRKQSKYFLPTKESAKPSSGQTPVLIELPKEDACMLLFYYYLLALSWEEIFFWCVDPWLDNGKAVFPSVATILKMTASGRVHSWSHFSGHEWTSGIDFTLGGQSVALQTGQSIMLIKLHVKRHPQCLH